MTNWLNKLLHRRTGLTKEQLALVQLNDGLRILERHLVAIARLQFIKPDSLVRESENTEANLEYLQKLIEIRKNETK
jgi:hypothetical protein